MKLKDLKLFNNYVRHEVEETPCHLDSVEFAEYAVAIRDLIHAKEGGEYIRPEGLTVRAIHEGMGCGTTCPAHSRLSELARATTAIEIVFGERPLPEPCRAMPRWTMDALSGLESVGEVEPSFRLPTRWKPREKRAAPEFTHSLSIKQTDKTWPTPLVSVH